MQHTCLKCDQSKKNRFSIKTSEPQIKQKNLRSSEKKQQWQHCFVVNAAMVGWTDRKYPFSGFRYHPTGNWTKLTRLDGACSVTLSYFTSKATLSLLHKQKYIWGTEIGTVILSVVPPARDPLVGETDVISGRRRNRLDFASMISFLA